MPRASGVSLSCLEWAGLGRVEDSLALRLASEPLFPIRQPEWLSREVDVSDSDPTFTQSFLGSLDCM